jgi:hypothetical protein
MDFVIDVFGFDAIVMPCFFFAILLVIKINPPVSGYSTFSGTVPDSFILFFHFIIKWKYGIDA